MENSKGNFSSLKFIESWYQHFYQVEAYLTQNTNAQLPSAHAMQAGLMDWINIQNKIKSFLPVELQEKLASLHINEKINTWELRYQQLAAFLKANNHIQLPADEAHEDLKDWLVRQIQDQKYLSESQYQRLDALGVDWDLTITRDQRWNQMYFKLKEFYQTFGHSQVPQNWETDKSLANWVCVQRRMYAAHKLHPNREQKLNALHFIWHIQTVYNDHWQRFYEELKAFYKTYGHCRVPGKQKQLTSWIENQRTAKKNGLLLADREEQLNKINFIWSFKKIKQSHWNQKYKELVAFKKKNGHCLVPINYKENKALGAWVASQRKLETNNRLGAAQKEKLVQLGFVWTPDIPKQLKSIYESRWNLQYERLKIYRQVYGTCQVSLKINPALQRWTRWQRLLFYQGKLSKERMVQLNEIEFPWNVQEGYWMKMYETLIEFKKQFGHTRLPHQWEPNPQLAAWAYRVRVNKEELSPQKIDLLNIIGFNWGRIQKTVVSWEAMFARLVAFKEQFGHTRVPVKWQPDPKLGKWVSRMRQDKDTLYPERVKLLNSIEFDWRKKFTYKKMVL